MSIKSNRPIITYENIALFQSDAPAHSAISNSGDNLSFLPLVQGLSFSFDIGRANAGAFGTKGFVDQSNRNTPDVNLTINTIEDFGHLFSGLISGNGVRENLNFDRNFYAVIGDKRGFDVSGESLSGRDVLGFGNCFLNNVSISQSVNGLMTSQYSFVGSNAQVRKIDVEFIENVPIVVADEDVTGFKVSGIAPGPDEFLGNNAGNDESGIFVSSGVFNGKTRWVSNFNSHEIRFFTAVGHWTYSDDNDSNPTYITTGNATDFPWNDQWKISDDNGLALIETFPQFYDFNGGGVVGIFTTRLKSPSIDLTGDQSQNISGIFSEMSSYYSNNSDKIIPYYSTNITISGSGSLGNFLIKSDSIQNFDLNLPINRKTIHSLGKKYPIKRKALFPSEGGFSFSNRVSNFEISGDRSNLKDFLNSDESYVLNISGQNQSGANFNFQISNVKLSSQSYDSAIGSDIVANLGFSFELNGLSRLVGPTNRISKEDGNFILTENGNFLVQES